jgi:WD40 repeat protein
MPFLLRFSFQFLIGYYKGLIVFWDNGESKAEHTYNGNQQLESLDWHHDGSQFISAHNDGSYIIWNIKPDNVTPGETIKPPDRATTPYGKYLFSCEFYFRDFCVGVMIAKIRPANMKIFKGFSITTLPKKRILDCCKDTI